jgi:DNA sulfur modification protein DndC
MSNQFKINKSFDRKSAFFDLGFEGKIRLLYEEIKSLYTADSTPWIIGYSGGKDSTACVQLVWSAIAELPIDKRKKKIYVISSDTGVENPIIARWVDHSLKEMKKAAKAQSLPFEPHKLRPSINDSFWVNLLGKGYPAPRHKFRWCTHRLKILPSNNFIKNIVSSSGEAILVLGTRTAESSARAANMAKHAKGRTRDRIGPNKSLPGTFVYSLIEDWSTEDVWLYLTQIENPWGYENHALFDLYAGASEEDSDTFVLDESTPSQGNSRFGCWVCTLVEKDKSMSAMIHNDSTKKWMAPLLNFRNEIDFRTDINGNYSKNADRDLRDFRRMSGQVQLMHNGNEIPGPYIQEVREKWLKKLLEAQCEIQRTAPPEIKNIELISMEELREIIRIWVIDKHEIEDSLPQIYYEATGKKFPGKMMDDSSGLSAEDILELKKICGEDRMHYELIRELLSLTFSQKNKGRRAGLFKQLEKTFRRNFYEDKTDALERARHIAKERERYKTEREELALQGVSELEDAAMGITL